METASETRGSSIPPMHTLKIMETVLGGVSPFSLPPEKAESLVRTLFQKLQLQDLVNGLRVSLEANECTQEDFNLLKTLIWGMDCTDSVRKEYTLSPGVSQSSVWVDASCCGSDHFSHQGLELLALLIQSRNCPEALRVAALRLAKRVSTVPRGADAMVGEAYPFVSPPFDVVGSLSVQVAEPFISIWIANLNASTEIAVLSREILLDVSRSFERAVVVFLRFHWSTALSFYRA